MGLKKAVAANRNTASKESKGKKKGGPAGDKSMLLERTTFDETSGAAGAKKNAAADNGSLIEG
jgi:hypothetical protein